MTRPLHKACKYCPRSAVCYAVGNWPWRVVVLWPINRHAALQKVACQAGTRSSGGPLPEVAFEVPREVVDAIDKGGQ